MTWEEIKSTVVTFFTNSGLNILKAIGVLVLGIIAVKLILKAVKGILSKAKVESITVKFIGSILKFALYIVLIMILMQMLGISITGVVAIISAAGLAIGLALQDSLSNLANGIILITNKEFKEGDYISVNGVEGKVKSIKMLTTTLYTIDNKKVLLPNSVVMNNVLTNYSAGETRRVDLNFSVSYDADVDKAKNIIRKVMESNGLVRLEPTPFISVKTLDDSSVGIFCNCWTDNEDYWTVYYYIIDNVFNEFKREGIEIPYNQLEVRLRNDKTKSYVRKSTLPKRVEKVRDEKSASVLEELFQDKISKIKNNSKNNKTVKKLVNKDVLKNTIDKKAINKEAQKKKEIQPNKSKTDTKAKVSSKAKGSSNHKASK